MRVLLAQRRASRMPRGHARKRSRIPSAARASESTQEAHASARTSLSALALNRARRLSGTAAKGREHARCPHIFLVTARTPATRFRARLRLGLALFARPLARASARFQHSVARGARAPRGALACAGRGVHALARGRGDKRAHKRARASAARAHAGPRGIPTRTSALALARERARACACACARGRAGARARAQGRARERAQARWSAEALVGKEGKKVVADVSCSALANTVDSRGTQRANCPPKLASFVLKITRRPDTEAVPIRPSRQGLTHTPDRD